MLQAAAGNFSPPTALTLQKMMGASWISEKYPSDENTRVCVAIKLPGKEEWVFAVGKAANVFGNDGQVWNTSNVLAYVCPLIKLTNLPEGTVVFPLVCPLRLVTPQGVVFVG